jgi:N-acetylneuraminate synthase
MLCAELGSCHDNDWAKVEALVRLCAEAGFSACKLQYWSSADRLADRRHATPEYRAIYHRYQIPVEWLGQFHGLCHRHGLEAVCTVYLPEDVEVVARWSDRVKIASFENEDTALLDAAIATGKPVIVSAGMLDSHGAVKLLDLAQEEANLSVIRCVSAYPASLDGAIGPCPRYVDLDDDASLHTLVDGYSDHTHNVWTGAVAVGCGAQILEVHVRAYDTDPGNPDYATALDPAEFALYAHGVRTAERLIADVPVDESAMRKFKVVPG